MVTVRGRILPYFYGRIRMRTVRSPTLLQTSESPGQTYRLSWSESGKSTQVKPLYFLSCTYS